MTQPCPFRHDDIDVLYGVTPAPIEELPERCTCGAPLSYARTILFVPQPADHLGEMFGEDGALVATVTMVTL